MVSHRVTSSFWLVCTVAAAGLCFTSLRSSAQNPGYAVGEGTVAETTQDTAASANAAAGPVRMARFSFIQGSVTWRPDESTDWATAPDNLPLKQGAQIWVASGGRAEVQFDDGSYFRLGSGAIATIKVLFSDTKGEFTQISLTNGLAMLQIRHEMSVYEVDTPIVSVKADGPARVRLGVGSGVEVGVVQGTAAVEGAQGTVTVNRGDYLTVNDSNAAYNVRALPGADSWESWNVDRDRQLDTSISDLASHNVPENITFVAGDLNSYGTWRVDPIYGQVWCPRVADVNWRPYYAGHWVWVNPFGWTWCSEEPWGWAPYHYGTWIHSGFGWAWVPGPVTQYWSPAVVSFSEGPGGVAWCALSPAEVRYPSVISVGFVGGAWAGFFSIGMAGCYYPAGGVYCVGRAYDTVIVNRAGYVSAVEVGSRFGGPANMVFSANSNTYIAGRTFVPMNARLAAGAVVATPAAFGGRGSFTVLGAGNTTVFTQGRLVGAPVAGRPPLAGPPAVRPTAESVIPTRTFVRSGGDVGTPGHRAVYQGPTVHTPVRGNSTGPGSGAPDRGERPVRTESSSNPRSAGSGAAEDAAERARNSVHHSGSGSAGSGKEGGGKEKDGHDRKP